jgi:N-acetylated-alpha-linked acidic dipeptidase
MGGQGFLRFPTRCSSLLGAGQTDRRPRSPSPTPEGTAAPKQNPPPEVARLPATLDEKDLIAAVSADHAWDHLLTFADLPRLTGSQAELEAHARIRERLESYGFRTRLHHHDAYISLPLAGGLQVIGPVTEGHYCITHSFSQPTPAGGIDLDLVDGGSAVPTDGSARGNAVLMNGLASPNAAVQARAQGAAALVMVNPGPEIHEMIVSPVWGSPGASDRDRLPTATIVSVNRDTGAALRGRLAQGPVRVRILAAVDTGWRTTPLLTADAGEGDDFVMFSGHLDSWYLGVMDNGGANAVMIETGRVLAQHAAALRRRLRLVFWSGHSHGRYSGSTWYADHFFDELDRHCAAHVNVDSAGAKGSVINLESSAMAEARRLVGEAFASQGFPGYEGTPVGRSGDQSFWGIGITAALGGISAQPAGEGRINLLSGVLGEGGSPVRERYAGFGWWWHTPDDTLEHMDAEALARDTRLYAAIVGRLCAGERLPFHFEDTAAEVETALAGLQQAAGERFDLSAARDDAAALRTALGGAAGLDDATQKALARTLNPVLYTRAGRFRHDPALGGGLLPGLQPAKGLAAADPDGVRFLAVDLTREQNRLCHALRHARELVS